MHDSNKFRSFIISLLASVCISQPGLVIAEEDYFVPGFEERDQLREDWLEEWINFLSQSETPWISLWGRLRHISGQYPGERSITPEQVAAQSEAFEVVFSEAGADLYSLVTLAHACNAWGVKEKCREHNVYQKIIRLDPENVVAYMIPITVDKRQYYDDDKEIATKADTKEIQQLILTASKLTEWEFYSEKLALEYYRTNLEFVTRIPLPTEEQRQVPDYVLAFMQGETAPIYLLGRLDKIPILCKYYEEEERIELIEACQRLAKQFRDNHFNFGYWMEANRQFLADPFDPEGLYLSRKAALAGKVRTCLETKWLKRKSLWPSLDRAIFENYIIDTSTHGRWVATRNASIAEYDSHPSRYDLDPRKCEPMLDLGSEEMGEILGENDPLHNRLEYQKRILLTEEYATHVTADERMMEEIEKLDTIDEVSDPLVDHLGSHGEPAMPFLFEKLCSSRRLTSLSAAYAISSNPSDTSLFDLLELWVEQRYSGQDCETVTAISSILRNKESQHRKSETDSFAADHDALLSAIFCDSDEDGEPADDGKTDEKPVVVVFSKQVTEERAIQCEFHPLYVRPSLNRFEHNAWVEENPYYSLRVKILDLPEIMVQMPAFKAAYGSRPIALADVYHSWGNGGEGQLWVKTGGYWVKVQDMYSIVQ